jgi:hypothetical protein
MEMQPSLQGVYRWRTSNHWRQGAERHTHSQIGVNTTRHCLAVQTLPSFSMVHGWHHCHRLETHSATSGWNHMTWSEEQWSPTHRDYTSERTGISLPSSLATWRLLRGDIHHIGYTPHECLQAKLLMGTMCDCSHISRILHEFIRPHGTSWQSHTLNLCATVNSHTLIIPLHLRLCGVIDD